MIARAAGFFLILAVCAAPAPTLAQDRTLPPGYRALWAAPTCDAPAQILAISAHFALSASAVGARIDPLAMRAQDKTQIKVEQGGENFFLALEKPDRLSVTALRVRNGIWPEFLTPGNPALSIRAFEKCDTVPPHAATWPALHPDGLAAFAALDRIFRSCTARPMAEDCTARLFAAADMNGDDLLDYREMAVAWRRALYVAAAGHDGCPFDSIFPGTSSADGPAHAAAMVAAADRNSDYKLSLPEIEGTPLPALVTLAAPLRRLLPGLPAPGAVPSLCPPP